MGNLMRMTTATALVLMSIVPAAAQNGSAPVASPSGSPVNADGTRVLTVETPMGDVYDTPVGLVILQKYMPLLVSSPLVKQDHTRRATIHHIGDFMPGFKHEQLAEMDVELRRIPAPPRSIADVPMGEGSK